MKKIKYIAFTIFFTVITVGVSINRHYAGDELYSMALYGEAGSCCEVPMDCCEDESDIIQFTVDYLNTSQESLDHREIILELLIDIYPSDLLSCVSEYNTLIVSFPLDDRPPEEQSRFLAKIQTFLL